MSTHERGKRNPSPRGPDPAALARRRVWPLHPLAFALFPPLSLYALNIAEVPWADVMRPVVAIFGGTLLLGLALLATVRDKTKAAVLLSAMLFFFFVYGQMTFFQPLAAGALLLVAPVRAAGVNPHLYSLPLWGALAAAVLVACLRSRRDFTAATSILNVAGLALVVTPLVTAGNYVLRHRDRTPRPAAADAQAPPARRDVSPAVGNGGAAGSPSAPDIYYIVLDAYGRQDVLKQVYGYDNEPFLRELEKRGFFIARRGRANYTQTVLSLAASLNMTYLDGIARGGAGIPSADLTAASRMVNRSAVGAFLRARGYQHVAIANDFPLTKVSDADVLLESGRADDRPRMTPFEGLLLNTTPLAAVPRAERTLYDRHRDGIRSAFSHLGDVPRRLPHRKFVYAHIIAPHPPFVFGPNGEPVEPVNRPFSLGEQTGFTRRYRQDEYRKRYVDQLRYVNRRVLQAIDDIFTRSRHRPIVIVQGDHGPRMNLDWQDNPKSGLREVFGNLNAFSLPDADAAGLMYEEISPVNSFRLLFNHYFGADFKRLPDLSYYSTRSRPYAFTDVTDETAAPPP